MHMPFADAPKCAAPKRNGEPCGNVAVTGTTVCRMHGGTSPRTRAAGLRRRAAGIDPFAPKIGDVAAPSFVDAETAALAVLGQLLRLSTFVGNIVERYGEADLLVNDSEVGSRTAPMVELLRGLLSDSARWTNSAMKLRLEDRRVRIDELRSRWIVDVLVRAIDGAALTAAQRAYIVDAVATELSAGKAPDVLVVQGQCGTEAGHMEHRTRGEADCAACAAAYSAAQQRRQQAKAVAVRSMGRVIDI